MTSPIGATAAWRSPDARRRGYTLVELLLVVAVMLITSAMAVPLLTRSIEGTRLRAGARLVATAHRYARGMAVLHQAQIALILDPETGSIRVVRLDEADASSRAARDVFPGADGTAASSSWLSAWNQDAERAEAQAVRYETRELLARDLDPRIRMTDVSGLPATQRWENRWWAEYRSNGMTDTYDVTLDDGRGGRMVVRVDGLTGRTEFVD
jgi:prepilin-type N-terminal cleavage/methylation domain-containing protein